MRQRWFSNCKTSLLLEGVGESNFTSYYSRRCLKMRLMWFKNCKCFLLSEGVRTPFQTRPHSLADKDSLCRFIVLHIVHPPFCAPPPPPPGKKFLDPPLMPIPFELRGVRPLIPEGALPLEATLKNVQRACM